MKQAIPNYDYIRGIRSKRLFVYDRKNHGHDHGIICQKDIIMNNPTTTSIIIWTIQS